MNFLQLRLISPFPTEYVKEVLSSAKRIVDVEMNYSGQLAGVIREMTCIPVEQLHRQVQRKADVAGGDLRRGQADSRTANGSQEDGVEKWRLSSPT